MGDKHLLICVSCRCFSWLELYEFPEWLQRHGGHYIMLAPDDVVGEVEVFNNFFEQLLDLFNLSAPKGGDAHE